MFDFKKWFTRFSNKKKKGANQKKTDKRYNVQVIKNSDVALHPNTITAIHEGRVDAVVIKDFLSDTEQQNILNNIADLEGFLYTEVPYGKVIGKKLNRKDGNFQKIDFQQLLSNVEKSRLELKTLLAFDLETRLANTLKKLCGQIESAEVAQDDQGNYFVPATIRVCEPYKGAIPAHVGNEFNYKMPDIKAIATTTIIEDQLSYFTLVNAAEQQGHLVLYDLLWENTSEEFLSDRASVGEKVEQLAKQIIPLESGDLLIFAGGRIWHKVTDVLGSQNRVTVGGFLGFTHNKKKLHFWS